MLKYEDSENIKTNCVDTVVFKLHQIKQKGFWGHPYNLFLFDLQPVEIYFKSRILLKC